MSTLIRFEDRYGMKTLYTSLVDADDNVIIPESKGFIKAFSFSEMDIRNCIKQTVNKIVFVFDVDDADGCNNKILNIDRIRQVLDKPLKKFDDFSFYPDLVFIPVVYTAETIATYQFYKGKVPLPMFVNIDNTKVLFVNILKAFTNVSSKDELKKYSFVDKDELRSSLKAFKDFDKYNRVAINFLLGQNYEIYTSIDSIENYLIDLHTFYNERISVNHHDELIIFDKKYEVYGSEYIDLFERDFKISMSR